MLETFFQSPPGFPNASVVLDTPNGHGSSTGTKIRRYTNSTVVGADFTYADSSTAGMTVTCNFSGLVEVFIADRLSSGTAQIGVSQNSNQLTTAINSITKTMRPGIANTPGTNLFGSIGTVFSVASGDVVRSHDDGTLDSVDAASTFRIVRIA